jgi:hypothetical protein
VDDAKSLQVLSLLERLPVRHISHATCHQFEDICS